MIQIYLLLKLDLESMSWHCVEWCYATFKILQTNFPVWSYFFDVWIKFFDENLVVSFASYLHAFRYIFCLLVDKQQKKNIKIKCKAINYLHDIMVKSFLASPARALVPSAFRYVYLRSFFVLDVSNTEEETPNACWKSYTHMTCHCHSNDTDIQMLTIAPLTNANSRHKFKLCFSDADWLSRHGYYSIFTSVQHILSIAEKICLEFI